MSPYQHGEVFVTDDGAETDLDLGHYERFTDESLTVNSSVTSGKVYWNVLNRERQGEYLGGTVPGAIAHITNEIKERIYRMGKTSKVDICITEVGGTVGDIEKKVQPLPGGHPPGGPGAAREDVMYVHVSLVVSIPGSGELKSKPTQHSCKELLSIGIQPDVIVCRADQPLTEDIRRKISMFCNIPPENAIPNLTAPILYGRPDAGGRGPGRRGGQAPGAGLPQARPDRVGQHGASGPRPPATRWRSPWWASMWPSTEMPTCPWWRP